MGYYIDIYTYKHTMAYILIVYEGGRGPMEKYLAFVQQIGVLSNYNTIKKSQKCSKKNVWMNLEPPLV